MSLTQRNVTIQAQFTIQPIPDGITEKCHKDGCDKPATQEVFVEEVWSKTRYCCADPKHLDVVVEKTAQRFWDDACTEYR